MSDERGRLRVSESRGKACFYYAERDQPQAHEVGLTCKETLSEAAPLVSLIQGDNNFIYCSPVLRGHCERAMFATTGALAPQRSPKDPVTH